MSVIRKDLGMVTAYAYAVSKGFTGTEEEFAELMASYADVAQDAAQSAEDAQAAQTAAEAAASAAQGSATSAQGSATSASASANTATTKAAEAGTSATNAADSALQAAGSAASAATKATQAETAAGNAATNAIAAGQSASIANTKAGDAAASATAASTSAGQAATSATQAADAVQGFDDHVQDMIETIPADYSELTSDVSDLKESLSENTVLVNGVIQKELIWDGSVEEVDMTRVTGYQLNTYGTRVEKAAFSYVWFVAPESATYKISVNASQTGVFVYNSNIFNSSTLLSRFSVGAEAYIEQGKYIAVSMWSLTAVPNITYSTNSSITLKDTVALSKDMKGEVDSVVDLALDDGYLAFSPDDFERGSYTSFTSKDSRTFRARCKTAITFGHPTKLVADPGFYLYAYIQGYSSQGPKPVLDIPANAPFVFYIRRISEDTSETIDVQTFVSKVHVSTALAPIELYAPCFTDITMFPRIGISGDSYSAGGGIISGVRDLTWGKNLERESGVTVDIYAKSGESIQQWTSDETNGLPALLAGEECGLYWFAHGINGTGSAASIGTTDDMSANPKPNTFYGQYVYAIQAIQRAFPRARIVVATIVGTGYGLYQTNYWAANTAIRNIAEYCGVPLVDLADDDFYKSNWYNLHHRSKHPTAMLNAGIAHANRRLFAKCVMDNPGYFIDYGNKYKTAISCPPVAGGFITASPSVAANGATVTLSNTPYPGYHFVRYESSDVSITDGAFVVPGSTDGPGHGTYTITGVFEAD